MEKILHNIREAETHADKIVAEAREKAALIISKGKTDADTFVSERKQMILTQKAELISSRKKELEKDWQKQEKKAGKHADALADAAQHNKKKTMQFLLMEFKKLLKEEV